jgi:hypothetical protein
VLSRCVAAGVLLCCRSRSLRCQQRRKRLRNLRFLRRVLFLGRAVASSVVVHSSASNTSNEATRLGSTRSRFRCVSHSHTLLISSNPSRQRLGSQTASHSSSLFLITQLIQMPIALRDEVEHTHARFLIAQRKAEEDSPNEKKKKANDCDNYPPNRNSGSSKMSRERRVGSPSDMSRWLLRKRTHNMTKQKQGQHKNARQERTGIRNGSTEREQPRTHRISLGLL